MSWTCLVMREDVPTVTLGFYYRESGWGPDVPLLWHFSGILMVGQIWGLWICLQRVMTQPTCSPRSAHPSAISPLTVVAPTLEGEETEPSWRSFVQGALLGGPGEAGASLGLLPPSGGGCDGISTSMSSHTGLVVLSTQSNVCL